MQLFQQSHCAETVTAAKLRHGVVADDELGAAAADIQNKHGRLGQTRDCWSRREKPIPPPCRRKGFLFPGRQPWRMASNNSAALRASRAALVAMTRTEDGAQFRGAGAKFRHGVGGQCNGGRLQMCGWRKSPRPAASAGSSSETGVSRAVGHIRRRGL